MNRELGIKIKVLAKSLRYAIKEQLYDESPLRNEFQIRYPDQGEIPLLRSGKVSYLIDGNGSSEKKIKGLENKKPFKILIGSTAGKYKRLSIPLFEIASNSEEKYTGQSSQNLFDSFIKCNILEEEKEVYKNSRNT